MFQGNTFNLRVAVETPNLKWSVFEMRTTILKYLKKMPPGFI